MTCTALNCKSLTIIETLHFEWMWSTSLLFHIHFRDKPWTSRRDVFFNYCSREWILWLVCVKDIKLCSLWRETTALRWRSTDHRNTDEDRTETSQRYGEVESFDYSESLFFIAAFKLSMSKPHLQYVMNDW